MITSVVDERFFRPAEVVPLIGNAAHARKELGWKPSVTSQELVEVVVDAHYEMLKASRKNNYFQDGIYQ